jgi:hypothetical protein
MGKCSLKRLKRYKITKSDPREIGSEKSGGVWNWQLIVSSGGI